MTKNQGQGVASSSLNKQKKKGGKGGGAAHNYGSAL
jgi:hypothetical protein